MTEVSTVALPVERTSLLGAGVLYSAGALQGLAVVSFPASSGELQGTYGLSDQAYGSLFIPQMIFTIAGSLAGGALAKRLGLRTLLVLSLIAACGSQLCLRSVAWTGADMRLYVLWLGTALMGTGFGLSAAPLNGYPALLFPKRADAALVAVHTLVAAGFALGPLGVSALMGQGLWTYFPVSLAAAMIVCAVLAVRAPLPLPLPARTGARAGLSLWPLAVFFAIAIVYAVAEGTFANWAIVFLTDERRVSPELAAIALSSFWAALAGGRLLVSALLAFVPAARFWIALPVLMIAVLLALPLASGAVSGIVLFALAGLACSAFFPLTVESAVRESPEHAATISSILIAALMIGAGGGSFVLGSLREAFDLSTLYRISAIEPAIVIALAAIVLVRRRKRA